MALRSNAPRACKETLPSPRAVAPQIPTSTGIANHVKPNWRYSQNEAFAHTKRNAANVHRRKRKITSRQIPQPATDKPFPFFELPRELRDKVYTHLVTRQVDSGQSIIAATPLLRDRKRRIAAQTSRSRLNLKRAAEGKPPIQSRATNTEPVVELNILSASQRLSAEAKDCLYTNNWFALTLHKLPLTTFSSPYGWDLSRITKLQLELQIKDAAHMNSYIDWTTFFTSFPALRCLRIVPTFHPRYEDWAVAELGEWDKAHYVHRAFFREVVAAVRADVKLRVGVAAENVAEMQLQGEVVGERLVRDMYAELGAWRGMTCARH